MFFVAAAARRSTRGPWTEPRRGKTSRPRFGNGPDMVLTGLLLGQTVLKDLPVPFSVTFEADVDPASFSVSVTGDAKGNKLELGS